MLNMVMIVRVIAIEVTRLVDAVVAVSTSLLPKLSLTCLQTDYIIDIVKTVIGQKTAEQRRLRSPLLFPRHHITDDL